MKENLVCNKLHAEWLGRSLDSDRRNVHKNKAFSHQTKCMKDSAASSRILSKIAKELLVKTQSNPFTGFFMLTKPYCCDEW